MNRRLRAGAWSAVGALRTVRARSAIGALRAIRARSATRLNAVRALRLCTEDALHTLRLRAIRTLRLAEHALRLHTIRTLRLAENTLRPDAEHTRWITGMTERITGVTGWRWITGMTGDARRLKLVDLLVQRRDGRVQFGDADVQVFGLFGIVSHTNLLRGRRRQGLKIETIRWDARRNLTLLRQ